MPSATAIVVLRRPSGRFPSSTIVQDCCSEIRRLGLVVVCELPFLVGIRGEVRQFETVLRTRLRPIGSDHYAVDDDWEVPSGLQPYVRGIVFGVHVTDFSWPDPSDEIIQKAFSADGTPTAHFKSDFGKGADPLLNMLFLSDVRALLGAADLNSTWDSGYLRGQGVDVYVVDSGIDLSHPFLVHNPYSVPIIVEESAMPDLSDSQYDIVGHGTMCACAVLNMAPACTLHVYHSGSGVAKLLDLGQAIVAAADNKPGVVSASWGVVNAPGLHLPEQELSDAYIGYHPHVVSTQTDLVNALFDAMLTWAQQHEVPVVVASGNALWRQVGKVPGRVPVEVPIAYSSVPGCMPQVISVGGAYPVGLDCGTESACWTASEYAHAGTALYVGPQGQEVTRNFPDVCGIVGQMANHGICVPWSRYSSKGLVCPDTGETIAGWRVGGGTSFATPTVAGILALLLQKYPLLPAHPFAQDVSPFSDPLRELLQQGSVDVETGTSFPPELDATNGPDIATGAGVLNVTKLVAVADSLAKKSFLQNLADIGV
jgi:subtilisin family serine protease